MRRFFVFILSLLVIFVLAALVTFLLPSKVRVTNSLTIAAPFDSVYHHISNLNTWQEWYPPMQDSSVHISRTESGSTIFLKDKKGKEVTLEKMPANGDTVRVRLGSSAASSVFYEFQLSRVHGVSTLLVLHTDISLKWYPWERIKGIFLDKMVSPIYEKALNQLKGALEK